MSDPFEMYDDSLSTEDKCKYSFKEFFNYHFYGGPNGGRSSDEKRQALYERFMRRLKSVPEKDQYEIFHEFININYWMEDELNKFRDHKRISKELEAQKKETSNAYRLMFFVFVIGCILGEIRGRFF
jgi:hypothetical protein